MDVFALRNRVVYDYKRYIESVVRIRDAEIEKYVRRVFRSGFCGSTRFFSLTPRMKTDTPLKLAAKGGRELCREPERRTFKSMTFDA